MTKLFLSAARSLDLHRPTDKISLTQYAALTLTGFIFTFYGLYVTPINYPLTSVNVLLCGSSVAPRPQDQGRLPVVGPSLSMACCWLSAESLPPTPAL